MSTLKKIWVDAILKIAQVVPYKNLGRFYRVPFKSILRTQIKRANISRKYDNFGQAWEVLNVENGLFNFLPENKHDAVLHQKSGAAYQLWELLQSWLKYHYQQRLLI